MSVKRGLIIVGVPLALAIAAYGSVALAAPSGGDTAAPPVQYHHHMRYQSGSDGTHDPANCPNMGGGSSTSPGSDASGSV
jgi:hypothetical protein